MILHVHIQVVSCQAGVRKENGVLVDYLEFRNSLQQIACWKLLEFEPTLEGDAFGRRLQVLRSNPQQLSIYLSHLIRYIGTICYTFSFELSICRSKAWNSHNSQIHTDQGESKEESVYSLSVEEKKELENLSEISKTGSLVLKSVTEENVPKPKTVTKPNSKEQNETKKDVIVNSKCGLEANIQKGILAFELIDVAKISVHKGIINERLDRHKIDSLKRVLLTQFDPKLSVITVAPSVKTATEYDKNKPDTTYKALEGRHLLTALKELYAEGKSFKGLEQGQIMAVVINCPGVVAANYVNLRQTYLSEKYTKKINIQDFIKLYKRIDDVIHERSRAIELVKNSMLIFDFHKDDCTAVSRICKWCEGSLIKIIELFEFYEHFQSLDSVNAEGVTVKGMAPLIKAGKKLAVKKLPFYRIAKIPEENLIEMVNKVISREISLLDLATWSLDISKMENVKQQCVEISKDILEGDEGVEDFEDLRNMLPHDFSDAKLVEFSDSVKGATFKTGSRLRLENHVLDAFGEKLNNNLNKGGMIQFVETDNLSSSFFDDANTVILNSKVLENDCIDYFVKKVKSKMTLLIICKTQVEFHSAIAIIQSHDSDEDVVKLYSVIVKDSKVKVSESSEISSCGILFLIIMGDFTIKNPPLMMYYEGLALCLDKIVQQITPMV